MSDTNAAPALPLEEIQKRGRSLLLTQFAFYRRLVAKKHSFTQWFDLEPAAMSDSELEQAVAFLKDAAHLPPG